MSVLVGTSVCSRKSKFSGPCAALYSLFTECMCVYVGMDVVAFSIAMSSYFSLIIIESKFAQVCSR